jgi:glycosyltransferase involved in cell wall biosynthesis
MKKIRVLLISPGDPRQPTFGDATYTRLLLDNPPEGVEYVYYQEGLQKGLVRRTKHYYFFKFLYRTFIWWPDVPVECLALRENYFDLVHAHAHPVKIKGSKIPIVLSDSSSNLVYLRDYKGIPQNLILLYYNLFRRPLAKLFNLADPNLNLNPVAKLIVWSKWAARIHLKLGCPSEKLIVLPPGLEDVPQEKINFHNNPDFIILFVGMDFQRKGGSLLLEAFHFLEKKYHFLKLIIVGSFPSKIKIDNTKIIHYPFVPYLKLLHQILPQANLLVLIPPRAEGYGLMPLQAAAYGIPALTTNIAAFPELIEEGQTGFLIEPDNKEKLIKDLELLIQHREILQKMGQRAREKFQREFSSKIIQQKLKKIYEDALKFTG